MRWPWPFGRRRLELDVSSGQISLSQTEKLIAAHRKRIKANPNDAAAHYALGNCLYAIGELDYACDEWSLATVLDKGEIGRLARERLSKVR